MKFEKVNLKKKGNDEILSLTFNDKEYEFTYPTDFVKNEKDSNIVALTFVAINTIALAEGVTFECKQIIKPTYNSCTVLVEAIRPDGVRREALIGRNKDNLPDDAKGDADNSAYKKACVDAFLALYGVPSSRFDISSGSYAPKKGSGINMNAIDNEDTTSETSTNEETPSVKTANEDTVTSNSENTKSHATQTMPFGTKKGETIYSILASDGGLDYFARLFAVNQPIRGNKDVSDAVFAYYEEHGADEKQKETLNKIREAIG